ncbi:MAG: tetratricopeptide repeat protein, partial [Candidatus Omnitrophica bacterium]|nr:tetratricopeptide repeat protein [Candidatus Omnitrophota bacterium]
MKDTEERKTPHLTRFRHKVALIFLGAVLFLILLETGLRAGGSLFLLQQDYRNSVSLKQKGEYVILCLGESTTAFGGGDSYPSQLERILNKRNAGVRFQVINKGIPATTTYLLENVERYLDEYKPNMVIAMMGVNDLCKHLPYEYPHVSKIGFFFRDFKEYKLARLLWLHLQTRAREGFLRGPVTPASPSTPAAPDVQAKPERPPESSVQPESKEYPAFIGAADVSCSGVEACMQEGHRYLEEGDYRLAEKSFKKVLELEPRNDRALIELAWTYMVEGVYFEDAAKAAEAATKINPRNPLAYFRLALANKLLGDYDKAEKLLEKTIALNPSHYWAYIELGNSYRLMQEFDKAETVYRQAVKVDPENGRAYFELGWNYNHQGRYQEAENCFKKVLELSGGSQEAHAALVVVYEEMGKRREAVRHYAKANSMRLGYYNPVTRHNYLRLKEILDKRG